jgi:hypothetical protein
LRELPGATKNRSINIEIREAMRRCRFQLCAPCLSVLFGFP